MMSAHSNYPLPQATGPPSQPFPSLPQQQQQQQQQQQLQYNHPQLQQRYPPPPPQQQQQVQSYQQLPEKQQAQARPTTERTRSRAFSFRSDKSQKSAGSHHQQLTETHAEKEAKRLHSKADPTLAMNEAEPAAVAQTVRTSLASLRSMSHRDTFGNAISDPDRSNPTRSRWERPLDTIRSFEAAIDGGYNRKSFIRSDAESIANWNRRSSYYGNNGARFPQDSYYGGRPNSMMPSSSQFDLRQGTPGRESYFDQGQAPNAYSNAPAASRQRYSRMASEPQFSSAYKQSEGQGVYPLPNNHRSYETVGSASGSGSSGEPAGYQTDPTSSDNSSVERVQSPVKRKPEPVNDYGIGFSQTATYQPSAFTVGVKSPRTSPRGPGPVAAPGPAPQAGGFQPGPPPVPRKDNGGNNVIARKPMRQPLPDPAAAAAQQQRPAMGEKRKSWFARRFSKQG